MWTPAPVTRTYWSLYSVRHGAHIRPYVRVTFASSQTRVTFAPSPMGIIGNYYNLVSNQLAPLQQLHSRWHDSCHSTASHLFVAWCSQQPFRVYWGGGEHSTYIIRFEALCSQQPFRVYWGGGEHSTYIIRFEALCSQQPFRVSWGGGEGGTFYLHHPLCKVVNFFL